METIPPAINKISAAVDLSQRSSTWVLLLVGVVALVVAVVSYGSRRTRVANLPPGPRNWPIIGALLEMQEPLFHQTLAKFATKYGPIVFFRMGTQNVVVVSSAEVAEELLKHRDAEFSDRTVPMTRSCVKYISFDGSVFPFADYDASFKLLRKFSITEFFTATKIKSYEQLRTQEAAVMVEKIFSAIQSSKDINGEQSNSNGPAPMGIRAIALGEVRNILFSLCIGTRFDSLLPTHYLSEFPDIVDEFMDVFMATNLVDFFPWLTWLDPQGMLKRMKDVDKRDGKLYKTMLETSRQEMRRRSEAGISNSAGDEGSPTDFLHVLLRAQENGAKISDNGIMGTILSMLLGGTETTALQVEWVLVEVVRHPKVFQRMKDELDDVVGRERPLEEADLQAMPFLNAVVLETLRLHAAAPSSFPHSNMQPSTLCGYTIPAKTAVIVNISSISRDPKVWKDPLEFNPDRFIAIGSSTDPNLLSKTVLAGGNNYNLLAFGSGRRFCPGYSLGIILVLRIVGSLVHAFDWSPPLGCAPQDVSIEEVGGFNPHPSPELRLVPTPRLLNHVYKSNIN